MESIRFIKSKIKNKKYTAILPDGSKVHFGDSRYKHYKDSVPRELGGHQWSHLDHKDKDRRKQYRARHKNVLLDDGSRAIDVKYSPAWFSYYYLW